MNVKNHDDAKINKSFVKLYKLRDMIYTSSPKNSESNNVPIDGIKCIESTLQLFEISNERTKLMMETYEDVDAFISILKEKSSDVNFLVQVCRSISEKNINLQSHIDKLTLQFQDDQIKKTHLEQQISLLKEFIEQNDFDICQSILPQTDDTRVQQLTRENDCLLTQIDELKNLCKTQTSQLESFETWQKEQTFYYQDLKRQISRLEEENQRLNLQLDYKQSTEEISYKVEDLKEQCNHEESVARYEQNEQVMRQTISDLNDAVEDYRTQLSIAYNKLADVGKTGVSPLLVNDESVSLQTEMDELESKPQPSPAKLTSKNRILRQLETARIIQKARKCLEASKWSVYTPHNFPTDSPIVTLSGGDNLLLGITGNNQGIRHRHTNATGTDSVLDSWTNKHVSGGSSKGSSSEGRQALTIVKPIGGSSTMASWKKLATPGMESLLSTPSRGVVGRLMSGTPTNPNK